MAIDRKLLIGCSNKMVAVVDTASGKVLATPPIGEGVDANGFDPGTSLGFSSNGSGHPDRLCRGRERQLQSPRQRADRARRPHHGARREDPPRLPGDGEAQPAPAPLRSSSARGAPVPGSFVLLMVEK
jgi:hypothetical protein